MKPFPPDYTMAVRCLDGRYAAVPCNKLGICKVPDAGTHKTIGGAIRAAWRDYESRVRALEAQDITRSDAQGIVDVQMMQHAALFCA